jgi:hypothetical protein
VRNPQSPEQAVIEAAIVLRRAVGATEMSRRLGELVVAVDEMLEAESSQPEMGCTMRTDWAAEFYRLDGSSAYSQAVDQEHADLIATGVNQHIASLNDPTRVANGIRHAYVASRSVTELSDGGQIIGPWERIDQTTGVTRPNGSDGGGRDE